MLPSTTPSHALPINRPITDGSFIFPLIQPKHPSQQYAAAHQLPPGSSPLLSSPLQHQVNCLQAIHKTNQQFHQHLKAEQLDRKTLKFLVLQLQNDFALLRYLLFSSGGTISFSATTAVKNSATSPLFNPKPNPNPNRTAPLLPRADAPKLHRCTAEGALGTPRMKKNNSANTDFQSSSNTREAPPTTGESLTSRISKLEKLFADEIAAYTSTTAGIHSQYFSLYDKIHQLEAGNSDAVIWKIPFVKFVFDYGKVARPSSDPLLK